MPSVRSGAGAGDPAQMAQMLQSMNPAQRAQLAAAMGLSPQQLAQVSSSPSLNFSQCVGRTIVNRRNLQQETAYWRISRSIFWWQRVRSQRNVESKLCDLVSARNRRRVPNESMQGVSENFRGFLGSSLVEGIQFSGDAVRDLVFVRQSE